MITELSALELAEKIENLQPLEKVEAMAAGAIIREFDRRQKKYKAGGEKSDKSSVGRKPDKYPSASAIYQRERRRLKKAEKKD